MRLIGAGLVWLGILAASASAEAAVVLVDSRASSCGDGQSWATAYRHLQDALTAARTSGGTVTEIWVAAGTYQPDRSCADPAGSRDRSAAFELVPAVALRGGFAGNEDAATFDVGTRDLVTHKTILSGDLDGNDGPDFTNNEDNSNNVVRYASVGPCEIDGFTITGGNAREISPGLTSASGGGLSVSEGSPTVIRCKFIGNSTSGYGGGLSFTQGQGTLLLINCLFDSNRAESGGGLSKGPPAHVINCTFTRNHATRWGGGIHYGGKLTLTNSILWGNTLNQITGFNIDSTLAYNCIEGGVYGNISTDPLLLADGTLSRLSPCLDAGDSAAVPAWATTDLAGNPRLVDDPLAPDLGEHGRPPRPAVDMGAYENQASAPPRRMHVRAAAPAGGNGKSWTTAYKHLQDALAAAAVPSAVPTEIWVAAGVYLPDRSAASPNGSGSRTAAFQLRNHVLIYGGFPGQPGQEGRFDVRDPRRYPTVLSGDLAGNDEPGFVNNTENSRVVTASSVTATALLDGFTISGGNAGYPLYSGGGLYATDASPTLRNCTFSGNTASTGGGLLLDSGSPRLDNCVFSGNSAVMGGALSNGGTMSLTNCVVFGNRATLNGGALMTWSWSKTILANCTLVANTAGVGGAIYGQSNTDVQLSNSIVWNNTATTSDPQIRGEAIARHSCVQGGDASFGGINTDPLLMNEAAGDLRLQPGSPCIDAGSNDDLPSDVLTDLLGLPRFYDELATPDCRWAPGTCGTAPIVDMGAFEFVHLPPDPAGNPAPADHATQMLVDLLLTWTAGEGADTHRVYFGTTSPGTLVGELPGPTFDPGRLAYGTTYYWRVDEVNPYGVATGTVWTFSTRRYVGDTDNDGDVDQEDFGLLQSCLSDRGLPPPHPGCDRAKLDQDGDVDIDDVAIFLGCHAGPGVAPPADCVR